MWQRGQCKLAFILLFAMMVFISGTIQWQEDPSVQNLAEMDRYLPRRDLETSILHPKISIVGDAQLAAFPNKTGSGVPGDPYVIKDITINAARSGSCIAISGTSKPLVIKNCTLLNSQLNGGNAGILLGSVRVISIFNCTFSNNLWGISLDRSNWMLVTNNTFNGNEAGIYASELCYSLITTNVIVAGAGLDYGIYFNYRCNHNLVSNNSISMPIFCGIFLYQNSINNTIESNTLNIVYGGGIGLTQSSYNRVSHNNITGGYDDGIVVSSAIENNLTNNRIINNMGRGMYLINSQNISISGNYIRDNWEAGIYCQNAHHQSFRGNTIYSNTLQGMLFNNADWNRIEGNNITSNANGLVLTTGATNNTVLNNVFVSNGVNNSLYDSTSSYNSWDDGKNGNYWSDYVARYPSAVNDGYVWNTPYRINGSGSDLDHFPLVSPFNPNTIPQIQVAANYSYLIIGESAKFYFTGHAGNEPSEFSWSFGDESPNSTEREPVHQYTALGNYSVSVYVKDKDGDSASALLVNFIKVIAIDYFPIANFTCNDTDINLGDAVQFNFTGALGNEPAKFLWNFGDLTPYSSEKDPVHVYGGIGIYTVSIEVTDANKDGDYLSRTAYVRVHPSRTQRIVITSNTQLDTFCATYGTDGLSWATAHVIPGFEINSNNIGTCIDISNTNRYLIIDQCTLSNATTLNYAGISLVNCTHVQINNCTISNTVRGIYLDDCNDIRILGNKLLGGGTGIYGAASCSNISHHGNEISGYTNGLYYLTLTNSVVQDCTIQKNSGDGIFLNSGGFNVLRNNNIWSNNGSGYYSVSSNNNTFDSNIVFNNGNAFPESGIKIEQSQNTTISNNIVDYNYENGIYLEYLTNCIVENNTIRSSRQGGSRYGIHMIASNYNAFRNNSVYNVSVCFLAGGHYNTYIANEAWSNGRAIYLVSSNNNIIRENYFWGSTLAAIDVQDAASNSILLNTVSGNSGRGIRMTGSTATNNRIWLNWLEQNTAGNAYESTTVSTTSDWDNGTLGNYWGDYIDRYPTATHNGVVWNTPYGIVVNSDRYPLVNPFFHDFQPVANFTQNITVINVDQWIQFTFTGSLGTKPSTYLWHFGDGASSNLQNPTHQYILPGDYSVNLTITDTDGDVNSLLKPDCIHVIDILPVADYTTNVSSILINEWVSFTFIGTVGNLPVQYYWDFGDGTNSTQQNPVHQYNLHGYFSVNCTIHDRDDDKDWLYKVDCIHVIDLFPQSNFTSNVTSILINEWVSFTFTGTLGDLPAQYHWDFGDGTGTSTIRDPVYQYTTTGLYDVSLTITDNDGDEDSAKKVHFIVVIDLLPVANFTANVTTIITGQQVMFTFTGAPGDSPTSFEWCFGDSSANSSLQDPIHAYSVDGVYNVTLTVYDVDGDTDVYTIPYCITVLMDFFPTANFIANTTTVIAGQSVGFNYAGTDGNGIISYHWYFGDFTPNATVKDPTHQYLTAGNYQVTLAVRDVDGDFDLEIKLGYIMVVLDLLPVANFDANATYIICGQSIAFTYTGTAGNGNLTYAWDFGDLAPNATVANPVHQFNSPGTFNITITVVDRDGDKDIARIPDYIIVLSDLLPVANFTCNATSIYQMMWIGFMYTGTSGNNIASYYWYFGDGSANATVQNPTHKYITAGIYSIVLTVVDVDGDVSSISKLSYITVSLDSDGPIIENLTVDGTKVFTLPVTVGCDVLDMLSGIASVELWYAVNQNVSFTKAEMIHIAGNTYEAQIPAQPFDSTVFYYYRAVDQSGNPAVQDNGGNYYSYELDVLSIGLFTVVFTSPVQLTIVINVTSAGVLSLIGYTASTSTLQLDSILAEFDLAYTGGFDSLSILFFYSGELIDTQVRVFHFQGGVWNAVLPVVNVNAKSITFQLTSLSPIVIGIRLGGSSAPPIPDNLLLIFLLIGGLVIGGVVYVRSRKKRIRSSSKNIGQLPQCNTFPWDESNSHSQQTGQANHSSLEVYKKEILFCSECNYYFTSQDSEIELCNCQTCGKVLQRVINCPLCEKALLFTREFIKQYAGREIECSFCHNSFLL